MPIMAITISPNIIKILFKLIVFECKYLRELSCFFFLFFLLAMVTFKYLIEIKLMSIMLQEIIIA